MLRKHKRYEDFWKKHSAKYPFQIEGVKINIMAPEHYKYVRCVSTPTGNRERIWGFKTQKDLDMFVAIYNMTCLFKYYCSGLTSAEIRERFLNANKSN